MREWSLRVKTGDTKIQLVKGAFGRLREDIEEAGISLPAAIVSNTTVGPLYGGQLATPLGLDSWIELPDGEKFKNSGSVEALSRDFLARGLHRRSTVLALGGGVITDLTGFAASIFMRGISWIAVPTTLLAMVDASIGGKTGINIREGKNLLGTFWPPKLVLIDPEVLESLPDRELRAGLAEVLKAGWVADPTLSKQMCDGIEGIPMDLLSRAIEVKVNIVQADEREAGARKALNLGHTLGHALESIGTYTHLLHGEAVAWGMRFVAEVSRKRGLLSPEGYRLRITSLRSLEPLPPIGDFDADAITEFLLRDKKRDAKGVGWVLPTDNGVLLDQRVEAREIRRFFDELKT